MTSYSIPTHDLSRMIALIKRGHFRTTHVARVGAVALGLIDVVVDLPARGRFYKTMESINNPGHWMDVDHTRTLAGDPVYLKLMIQIGVLIVSFKEL
ncbi:hypothetical protein ASF04_17635 [Duganella sp. Leaf61]|uniref:type II toxin-antitoxin system MqsR family toxin n=1 Tax=Duganella sp. Leaf61 TaxID=1736227 RepID=UPI00070134E6|nr:type II toxin-antitoxin system MqsR family toxin [Duganella sp. Leaf61]KQN67610.1 hypothetical protein ASF04_17635 [Duganella sp. Leaf61]